MCYRGRACLGCTNENYIWQAHQFLGSLYTFTRPLYVHCGKSSKPLSATIALVLSHTMTHKCARPLEIAHEKNREAYHFHYCCEPQLIFVSSDVRTRYVIIHDNFFLIWAREVPSGVCYRRLETLRIDFSILKQLKDKHSDFPSLFYLQWGGSK